MKQFLPKGMATRLLGLMVAFLMVASQEGGAQIGSINPHIQTRSGSSGDILKIDHKGSETQYADWATAMTALQEGDEITLLQDITLTINGSSNPMPTKSCVINGGNYTLKFQDDNNQETNCNLQAPVTFKNIKLSASILMGNGNQMIFDNGATMNNGFVFGGGQTEVASTSITIKNGATLINVYGGGYKGKVTGDTQVIVEGGTVTSIFAGGYSAPVEGTTNLTISDGVVGNNNYIFGGGWDATATCGNTNVVLSGGTIDARVLGGGYSGPVLGTAKVSLQGSTVNKNLFGGGSQESATCKNTDVTVSSGFVNKIYGGGKKGTVTETAKLTLSGGTIKGDIFGGGDEASATCGSTHIEISGGTYKYINGGGYNGSVTGECYLKISGDPTIVGYVFGGSNRKGTTVGSTHVEISGGTFKDPDIQNFGGSIFAGGWGCTVKGNTSIIATGGKMGIIYGGCSQGSVEGATYVEVKGATLDGGTDDNGNPNSALIYGGGYGDGDPTGGYDPNVGKVGSTQVLIKNLTAGAGGVTLYGGGLFAGVTGNTDVTIEDGTFEQVWGGSHTESSPTTQFQGTVGGDVNILVKGGKIASLGAVKDQRQGQPVGVRGNMNLTIAGGEITRQISSGNNPQGSDYKPCTLTIRNLGTESAPFKLPETYAITHMILENSTVTCRAPEKINNTIVTHAICINKDYPLEISGSGNGKLIGDRIILSNFNIESLPTDVPLVTGDEPLKEATFIAYEGSGDNTATGFSWLPIYKVGNTYRKTKKESGDIVKAKVVTINQPSHGKLTVKWIENGRENILDDGDQVPVDTELTLSLVVNSGYQGGKIYVDSQPLSGSTYTVTGDVTISAGDITQIPVPEPAPDPVPPVYYTVTLPQVEGAVTDPVAGNYEVEAWDSFRFYLTLDKEYDQSEPVVTTDRYETIQPRTSDGAYIIKYVRQPIVIKIDGVVKNPDAVANETVDTNGIKIYAANGYLHIQTPQPEQVSIFTPDGRLLKAFRTSTNEERIALPKGIYLIRTANQSVKVVL